MTAGNLSFRTFEILYPVVGNVLKMDGYPVLREDTPYNGLYREAQPERGASSGFRYLKG